MKKSRLEAINISRSFQKGTQSIPVLKEINLRAEPGEVVVIRGKSGAGKSVLLWILSGLDNPDSGRVVFDGLELNSLGNSQRAELRRSRLGIIFQNFNLIGSWTAYENVEIALRNSKLSPLEKSKRINRILSELGLSDRLQNLPAELSIGQQQRVAIARTLATNPELILADEPTGDVDPETGAEIIEMLLTPVKAGKTGLIVATHGNFPLETATRVYTLDNGVLIPFKLASTPHLQS
ncbi:ABC transporter ATP-binding protein [Dehalococcoides mccartyi]|uniref:ABC transporter ATP-binding protein n=1 Tax=Dehalococcoides mccartyi TaxID=61435 RepID=UPI0006BD1E64|nr:ABC transporter ATP-binding protein [Dehalococcoides mccartyi]BAS31844.1 ABC transporter ATP-binding protein [Dehalococcoides mccartyi IBARAKI]